MADDTGTGGFNIDGKLYTLDTGVPDAEGGAQGEWSSGVINVDKTQKDISKPTKETLADYVSRLTKAKIGTPKIANRYTIDPNLSEISTTDEQGYPAQIRPSTNSEQFASDLKDSLSDDSTKIAFKKGLSSENLPDGNELLPNVSDPRSPVPTYQSAVLSHNKWYTPTNPLNPDQVPNLKTNLSIGTSSDQEEVSFGRLATIGTTLMLRASAELGSKNPNFDPNSQTAQVSAILPGVSQAGVAKVNAALLTAQDILQDLTSKEVNFKNEPVASFGAINNPNDPFTGLNAFGMITLSTALVAALQVAINSLFLVFGSSQITKKQPSRDTIGRYSVGSYYYGRKPKNGSSLFGNVSAVIERDFTTLLGIYPTTYSFIDCLQKGSNAFFGIDDSNGIASALISGFGRANENPGFNVVIARSIIRSASQLIEKTKNVQGNTIEVAGQTLGLIELLKGSKLISACNVFAQLGDAILSIGEANTDTYANGNKISSLDAQADDNSSAVRKSRLKNSLKLAWAGDRTNTLLMRPKNIISMNRAGRNIGVFNRNLSGITLNGLTLTKVVDQRISAEDVIKQENRLDAEYVPFYFHDLRTNEIVSFHAFLSSLNEDYSANYESAEAYGRVDPIKIYKNTNRNVSFSFYAAATSPDDFEIMWIKINKLITLLYPQYTSGKLVSDGQNYTFRQPFSQQIGASPMIRLRIGDLIKSNYSRFNLARLFGLGDPSLMLNGKTLANSTKSAEEIENFENKKLQVAFNAPAGLTFVPAPTDYGFFDDNTGNFASTVSSFGGPLGNAASTATANAEPKSLTFTQDGNLFAIKAIKKFDDLNIIGEIILNEETNSEILAAAVKNKRGAKSGDVDENFLGGRYIFPISSLSLTQATEKKMYDKILGVEADEFTTELETFMSNDIEKGNAIAKSFKTTQGKGLAGFIQTLSIDWMEQGTTWETTIDRTAPKICKINIGFSPIHDISPGLDASGYNRAPVYGVGVSGPGAEKK